MNSTLIERLGAKSILVAPGVYDALTAAMAAGAGFEAAYISGAAISYTRLGRPDLGFTTMEEVAGVIRRIRERVGLHLIADADTGFGDAAMVGETARCFEAAGASCIQLEDQQFPKRCGHLGGKSLVSSAEMVEKLEAAVEARESGETLVLARTDAIAVEGLDAALERARAYVAAGADALFVEAPRTVAELAAVADALAGEVPLLANMVEGGKTPLLTASELEGMGYSIVIFPGGVVRALIPTLREYYDAIYTHGTTAPIAGRMLDFDGLNELLETERIIEELKKG